MELLISLAIVICVAAFVAVPLRRARRAHADAAAAELSELEARKQTKYAEIRDAEADHAAGKLTDRDYERLDGELRAEAVEILKRIDSLRRTGAAG